MPSHSTVERFVGLVEAGQGIEALVGYYAEHAQMRENFSPPRVGKAALLKFEQAAQASVRELRSRCIRPILVSGDTVVIRWVFEYVSMAGRPVYFEELAWQRWEGELIVDEQFFYDPAQFA